MSACIFNSCFCVSEKEAKKEACFFSCFCLDIYVCVYIYLELLLLLLCWLAYVAYMQIDSGWFLCWWLANYTEEAMSVKNVRERTSSFFNTHRPIRCVNARYGSEWFRMYLDELHVLDPTQFPASFITLFTDSLLWHGNRVLTQTVWEHMSIKYNGGYSSSHRVCSHSRLSVSMCGYMCHPRRLPLPLTRSCHQSLHAHVCVHLYF